MKTYFNAIKFFSRIRHCEHQLTAGADEVEAGAATCEDCARFTLLVAPPVFVNIHHNTAKR